MFCAAVALLVGMLAPESFIPEAPAVPPPVKKEVAKPAPQEQVVNLSELDELRAELAALKEENAQLRQRVDELTVVQAKAPAANIIANRKPEAPPVRADVQPAPKRRNWSQIEVGMTRHEVDLFISTHKNLKLVSVSANSGVASSAEETIRRREGTRGGTLVSRAGTTASRDLGPGAVHTADETTNDEQTETVERRVVTGKREVLTVAKMSSQRVQTGSKRNSLGGSSPTYGTRWQEVGRLTITLTDDVVTAIDGRQL